MPPDVTIQAPTVALPSHEWNDGGGEELETKHTGSGDCASRHQLSKLSCQFPSPFLFSKLQGDSACPEPVLLTRELYKL